MGDNKIYNIRQKIEEVECSEMEKVKEGRNFIDRSVAN